MVSNIKCPRCLAESFNRYGKTAGGKQRYICLVCSRQFVANSGALTIGDRPECPLCGKKMHVYIREEDVIRFRCSNYPECKGFEKIQQK